MTTETLTPDSNDKDTTMMSGSDAVLQALADQGVDVIFGYPGGAVLPIYDALYKKNSVRHILVRHEQGAAHAAEGYARSTGKVGVLLVTSGPGATNTVTGLTDALMDSIPIVCLTGQVPTHMIGNDAFQEADTCGITRPCTKHNYLVTRGEDLAAAVHEAFEVARSGRPGPVVIDLPKDILNAMVPYTGPGEKRFRRVPSVPKAPDTKAIEKAVDVMASAERPVFYGGGGIINAGAQASEDYTTLVRETGYPTTLTLMGLGAFPYDDPQFLEMLGMHGSLEANLAMFHSDVMINIGARFDDRVTGNTAKFSPDSTKIHVDVDPSSINKNIIVDVPVIGDAGLAIKAMLKLWRERGYGNRREAIEPWWKQIDNWRSKGSFSFNQDMSDGAVIRPQYAIQRLHELCKGRETYITTEVGQHQMWAAQHFKFDKPNRWMTSGGLGTMGYGYPAAMGVQVAHPDALVIDIAGEASWLMNMQEMSTLVQYRLPVKAFILNNEWMGMVRQWQELFHGDRKSESYVDSLPDFVALAEAFNMKGVRAHHVGELDDVIREMIEHDGPVIADIRVNKTENVYPMIPAGAAHSDIKLAPQEGDRGRITDAGMQAV